MTINKFLKLKDRFELKQYIRSTDADKKGCVSFYGSPRKHPYEKHRLVLVSDPFSEHTFYYEFNVTDVLFAEEQPNITDSDGNSVTMVRIWVKKKSIGLRSAPFVVDAIGAGPVPV